MVDTLRQQPWTPPPPGLCEDGAGRDKPGPIYDLAAVQTVLKSGGVYLATQKCSTDVEKLEWDVDDVAQLIGALVPQDYRNSSWCCTSQGQVIDADAYGIWYDPLDGCRGNARQHKKYYVKFGFRPNDTRLIMFVISCHLSISYH